MHIIVDRFSRIDFTTEEICSTGDDGEGMGGPGEGDAVDSIPFCFQGMRLLEETLRDLRCSCSEFHHLAVVFQSIEVTGERIGGCHRAGRGVLWWRNLDG